MFDVKINSSDAESLREALKRMTDFAYFMSMETGSGDRADFVKSILEDENIDFSISKI